ncbi:MAG: galactokinase [Bacillota bacterium]
MKKPLHHLHKERYKQDPQATYYAPGVLNLLGTHAEREGGKVLSLTHSIGIEAAVSARIDRVIQLHTGKVDGEAEALDLETLPYDTKKNEAGILAAVLRKLIHEGYDVSKGMDITLGGPLHKAMGIGYSSSLLMLFFTLVLDQNAIALSDEKRLRYASRVLRELDFPLSTPTDPLTLLYAREGHLLYSDSKTQAFERVPFDFDQYALILLNTNRNPEHSLKSVEKRQLEVREAFKAINQKRVIASICDLGIPEFNQLKTLISNPTVKKRVEHVVFESDRVIQAKEAIERGDYILFSGLLEQSHTSLRELYEVSSEELNFLASEIEKLGALASKLTGVGFGGTLVALYDRDDLPESFDDLKHRYQKRFHKTLETSELKSVNGVGKVAP